MKSRYEWFDDLFREHFQKIFRYLDRLSGEPDLAADLAQDTFERLYRRGGPPEKPVAWLITVGTNLFRNARTTRSRRTRLLTAHEGDVLPAPAPSPAEEVARLAARRLVRTVLDQLSERDRRLLLLRAEGYSYRDLALALDLEAGSVGTLLARAKQRFTAVFDSHHQAATPRKESPGHGD